MENNFETFGNYILLEKLAAGGMAEIYLAKKLGANGVQKFVAIKRILQQYSDSEEFIAMFKDEAKIAINLSHSNVVSIYDFGVEAGQFYIVMEFVEGRNLRQILNRMKRTDDQFSVAQVAHIVGQVAAGLDHAHRCIDPTTGQSLNIIHRDMSPQNVMLGFEGDAKVVDFGIAKASHQIDSTRAGTLKGKFGYMSPEQIEGQAVDSRTDIFALGIMLWEMLANQRLFLANSEINTLRKIRECNVPNLRDINPNIPSELEQIVKKSLEKDRLERYQSAAYLRRDLQGFLSRFDPDFSAHDLSQFVKNLFSEEIIQIRKKQIVYAQVQAAGSASDKTQVIGQEENTFATDDVSFDAVSFGAESAVGNQTGSYISGQQVVNGFDVSTGHFEISQIGKNKPKLELAVKREAHRQTSDFQEHTYTKTNIRKVNLDGRNRNATLLTLIFSASFILVFFAYLNKFHPEYKKNICRSLSSYGACPGFLAAPSNLLMIQTSPDKASIFIDGEKLGTSPTELTVKQLPISVRVSKPGYRTVSRKLEKVPESNNLSVSLVRIPSGYLRVKAVGVQIFIDGIEVKSGQKVSVPANKAVTVKVVNPFNGRSKVQTHKVRENTIKSIVMTLSR